jgi:hypothetical protein
MAGSPTPTWWGFSAAQWNTLLVVIGLAGTIATVRFISSRAP